MTLPKDIALIIFDLGGVLLDIDYGRTQQAFEAIGIPEVDSLYSQARQTALFDDLETGHIDPHTFRAGLRALIAMDISDEQLDHAWNALLGSLPSHRLDFVRSLRPAHKTCVLSNTNAIHIEAFEQGIASSVGMDYYRSSFDAIFYSSRIGCRKPDSAAFDLVLQHFDVAPAQTLFIDDSEQHIHGAAALGIPTIFLQQGVEVKDALAQAFS